MRSTILAALAAASLACGGSAAASAADSSSARPADRAEIEALMWRYIRSLDSFNAEGYAAAYTPDGQFGTGKNAEVGRDALKKMISDLKKSRAEREAKGEKLPKMYHVIANSWLEFVDADHARLHSYWMTMFAGSGAPGAADAVAPRVAAVGRSVDDLVRLNGHWLIKQRDVAPQD